MEEAGKGFREWKRLMRLIVSEGKDERIDELEEQ